MRVIHCADLHLDSPLRSFLPSEKAKSRKAEILNTFVRILDFAKKEGVAAVLLAGDLFDGKRISSGSKKTILQSLKDHPEVTVYYIHGNHDFEAFADSFEDIPDNLKLFSDRWDSYILNENEDCVIKVYGLELTSENATDAARLLQTDESNINLVMLHGQEAGSVSKEKCENINIKEWRNKGIDYMALGHVHSYKSEALDGRGVYCYCGCPDGRGFDECGKKGFVLLDIDENKKEIRSKFVPFSSRELYSYSVDVSGLENTLEALQRIEALLEEEDLSERALVKIKLVGEVSEEYEVDCTYLCNVLSERFFFFTVEDRTRIRFEMEKCALDATLKGEFLRTLQEHTEITDEERDAIMRIGLRCFAGEKL